MTASRLSQLPALARICTTAFLFALVSCCAMPGARGAETPLVTFEPAPGSFPLHAANLAVAASDHAGVLRAARDLQTDIERVTTRKPRIGEFPGAKSPSVIIGTIGRSPLIDGLVRDGKLDVSAIRGRWEAFLITTINTDAGSALVIAGSDQRGTIYGIYTLSAAIGVSPWYWWADVPVVRRDALHVSRGPHVDTGPAVKYRGIFLNDEAPAMTNWAREKFGGFNHKLYAHVFELILRLRGNYIWPAMWVPNAFNDDDPLNPQLASDYGIVMGTSHHEPLMRAHDEWRRYGKGGAWDYATNAGALRDFWRGGLARVSDREQIVTIGMRGDGDRAMSGGNNIPLLEKIVTDQRNIIREVTGRDPATVPQLWALYKEVQEYYENGMKVPDDVTLLWCDDNWGNIRRLPTPAERSRPGGAGIYYHFDYVGGPRNYKWLNTYHISKIQEQMNLAWEYGADRIWIVNVGDLKPMEFPIEFFLAMAWKPSAFPATALDAHTRDWAARNFGQKHYAEIAKLIDGYTRFNARCKPELLSPDTYSFFNYNEANRVIDGWRDLVARAEKLNSGIPREYHDAFYQLVLYPIKASATMQDILFAAGLNKLYIEQGRVDANAQADRVRSLLKQDEELSDAYHALRDGKWNHMMEQIHHGYSSWKQPDIASTPPVSYMRPFKHPAPAIAIEGSAAAWPTFRAQYPSNPLPPRNAESLPPLDSAARQSRWLELFNRGLGAYSYSATADQPWIILTPAAGKVADTSARLEITADWNAVPLGESTATITIKYDAGAETSRHAYAENNSAVISHTGEFIVTIPVYNPDHSHAPDGVFLETDGHIVIEAPHCARVVHDNRIQWQTLPGYGRVFGAMTTFPVTAEVVSNPGGPSPRIEYDFFVHNAGTISVELHCAPSLDFLPNMPLRIGVSFDDAKPKIIRLDSAASKKDWNLSVSENIRRITDKHTFSKAGVHTLKLWYVTPGVVVERIIINTGKLRPSYLGPPESPRAGR